MNMGLVVLGMAVVTYLPRVIPLILGERLVLPPYVRRWLELIPYAALGALIFPGIIRIDPSRPWIGLSAGVAASLAVLVWSNPLISVIIAVAVVLVLS